MKQIHLISCIVTIAEMKGKNSKRNCWEVMNCGRGPGSAEANLCPVSVEGRLNGVHGGRNAGRACWVVAGTLCDNGKPSGKFAQKMETCIQCPFYRLVRLEEEELRPHQELLLRSKNLPM